MSKSFSDKRVAMLLLSSDSYSIRESKNDKRKQNKRNRQSEKMDIRQFLNY